MMISWRLYLVFTVILYSKSAMSCYFDSDCPGLETCCDSYCASSCSNSSGGTDGGTVAIIVVLCLCVVIGKVAFCVCIWYCRYKRVSHRRIVLRQGSTAPTALPQTVVTTFRTPTASRGYTRLSEEDNTVRYGLINPSHGSLPETTLNQGNVITNPANISPPPYTEEIQS